MTLSTTAESRIRGYLFVLERSLRSFLSPAVVEDASREVESHILERLEQLAGQEDERALVERVLAELGPPLRVAQAYSAEMAVDEAVTTGRFVAITRALWHVATATVGGFFAAVGIFTGYATGFGFICIAVLQPIFPQNVGIMTRDGLPYAIGAHFPIPDGTVVYGGWWVIPVSLAIGLIIVLLTNRCARKVFGWWRRRRAGWRRLEPRPQD